VTTDGAYDPGYEGRVFRITPSGSLTTLYTWQFEDPTGFPSELVKGPDGNFYGITTYCCVANGISATGTIFRITPAGQLTTLRNLDDDDGMDPKSLVVGGDGALYFTMNFQGLVRVLRMSLDGATSVVYDGDPYGLRVSQLIWGQDGNLYGVAAPHWSSSDDPCSGMVFKLTTGGVATTLHTFAAGEGRPAALVQRSNGTLYGVSECGAFLFEVTTAGAYTRLLNLTADEGNADGENTLVPGPNGTLFGANMNSLYRVIFGASLTIRPKDASLLSGKSVCVSATKNGATAPVAGFPLNFDRTGINPGSKQAVTDAEGKASVCWAGTNHVWDQHDEVDFTTVSDGAATDTSRVTWTRIEAYLTAEKMIAVAKGSIVKLNPSAVLAQYGSIPLPGRTIAFYTGSEFLCAGVTDIDGRAKCVATPRSHLSAIVNQGYTAVFGGDAQWYPKHAQGKIVLP